MSTTLRRRLVRGFLHLARSPSLPPPVVAPETEAGFASAADELLAGEATAVPEPRLDFLRWLVENRPVVFHGSSRDDLRELPTAPSAGLRPSGGSGERTLAQVSGLGALPRL
jgi:hypothetical protein